MANAFGNGQMPSAQQEREENQAAQEARHEAKMAGRHALAAKIHWEAVEKQWLATADAYMTQAAQYGTMTGPNVTTGPNIATGSNVTTGILAAQDWDGNGINGPIPPLLSSYPWFSTDRPLTIMSPDPDAVFDTYPAIRRGYWTHGGFPLDNSFGHKESEGGIEPARHSGFLRSADQFNHHQFYQPGTIISMMWHQDYTFDTLWKKNDKSRLTLNRQLGVIYSKRRKFIVVARFKDDYIALPIWTSYADKLKKEEFTRQRSEFMQIYHQGDITEDANKMTPYEYLFQLEKRRQPNVTNRQTSKGFHRDQENDWLDMKPNGEALLRLTTPVPFSYKVKCQVIGHLQPDSVEYLLKNWATEMQRSTMGHIIRMYRAPGADRARRRGNEATQTVDNQILQFSQQLNIGSEASSSSDVWNSVNATSKRARRAHLARSLEGLASALEAAETLIAEATLFGAIYETAVDTMGLMQNTREFLKLLTKIVADPSYEISPSIGVNSPASSSSPQWPDYKPESRLGEPRFVVPGSTLSLTAGQHAQLGHSIHVPKEGEKDPQQPESSPKKRKIG